MSTNATLSRSSSKTQPDTIVFVQSHGQTTSIDLLDAGTAKKQNSKVDKRTYTGMGRSEDSLIKRTLYDGRLIVNGFHPELCSFQENKRALLDALNMARRKQKNSTSEEIIFNQVNNCRKEEQRNIHKRLRLSPAIFIPSHQCTKDESTVCKGLNENSKHGINNEPRGIVSSILDLDTDYFKKSTVAQIIVNTGGRGVICNTEFLKIYGTSRQESVASFTLFNLVVPSMLPKLFAIFSSALKKEKSSRKATYRSPRGRRSLSVDESNLVLSQRVTDNTCLSDETMYKSVRLPCVILPTSTSRHYVTVVFMDADELDNRYFLCIISPAKSQNPSVPYKERNDRGEIIDRKSVV